MAWRDQFIDQIVCGDCAVLLKELPNHCIDLTITSPPYDQLRDYKGYSFPFEPIAKELLRVTKKGGVLVWVVGDETINGGESGTSFRQALAFKEVGWILHDTMIYQKKGVTSPQATRYHQCFEYMFVLRKGGFVKTFHGIKDRRNTTAGSKITTQRGKRKKDGIVRPYYKNDPNRVIEEWGLRYNVWILDAGPGMSTHDEMAFAHPAIFPEALAEDHIQTWTNVGDLVLDPMVGSGTTCKMAKANKRHWMGMDISEEYCALARRRVQGVQMRLV